MHQREAQGSMSLLSHSMCVVTEQQLTDQLALPCFEEGGPTQVCCFSVKYWQEETSATSSTDLRRAQSLVSHGTEIQEDLQGAY
jgi:hypothetical protein